MKAMCGDGKECYRGESSKKLDAMVSEHDKRIAAIKQKYRKEEEK
jgi:hypothetical protein